MGFVFCLSFGFVFDFALYLFEFWFWSMCSAVSFLNVPLSNPLVFSAWVTGHFLHDGVALPMRMRLENSA